MWRFNKSNGITEGFHREMKLIQRHAYGFENFKNYRLYPRAQAHPRFMWFNEFELNFSLRSPPLMIKRQVSGQSSRRNPRKNSTNSFNN